MEIKKIVNILSDLIEISRNDAEGFKTCAETIESAELKFFFRHVYTTVKKPFANWKPLWASIGIIQIPMVALTP